MMALLTSKRDLVEQQLLERSQPTSIGLRSKRRLRSHRLAVRSRNSSGS